MIKTVELFLFAVDLLLLLVGRRRLLLLLYLDDDCRSLCLRGLPLPPHVSGRTVKDSVHHRLLLLHHPVVCSTDLLSDHGPGDASS